MSVQHTRAALSEIPERFEDLRLSTTAVDNISPAPTNNGIDTVFNTTTLVDNRANVELVSQDPGNIWTSPDELLIKQRGRRRLVAWSPEELGQSPRRPFQRTPTKDNLTAGMILRSSPRKRLTMGSVPPLSLSVDTTSPSKTIVKQHLELETHEQPSKKKLRLGIGDNNSSPFVQKNNKVPLANLLRGYSKAQLIDIIINEITESNTDNSEEQLRSRLPMPRLDEYEEDLLHAKRNIYKSLPTSRLCRKTDGVAYARASVHLTELKRILFIHLKCLHEGGHWDALLDYAILAWKCIRSTPIWDNAIHNAIRRQCFKALLTETACAIKQGNANLGANRVASLEKNLKEWSNDYEDSVSCITVLSKMLSSKGRVSL